jgi:hypothetical protein
MSARVALLVATMASASTLASCTDPVVDDAIAELDEEPGYYLNDQGKKVSTEEGEYHRQGEPCVLCHQKAGTASGSPFLIAGTVYQTEADRKAAPNVQILLVDAYGRKLDKPPKTNKAGNFFIRPEEWPGFSGFPFRVAIYRDDVGPKYMQTHVGREPSCAGCHRDPKKGVKDDKLSAVGHIYLPGAPAQ